MADAEKTEEPTSKKIEDARNKGNVPKSADVNSIFTLIVGFVVLYAFFGAAVDRFSVDVRYYFSFIGHTFTKEGVMEIALFTAKEVIILVLPIALAVAIAGVAASVSQFGFNFTTDPLKFDLSKINPVTGLKNLFSLKKVLEGLMITLKVFAAFSIGMAVFWGFIKELPEVEMFSLAAQLEWLNNKAIILTSVMIVVLIVFAAIDLAIKRYQYFSGLKMTKQEIKDEHKNMEGDPKIKAKIRQMQMQMARNRMIADIPSADVVITNPTHYAVALRYKQGKDVAPTVVAAGVDFMALKIREIARNNNIQIVENPPLARSLYKACKVGDSIPDSFYKAVAEVLAYVYEINKKINPHR